MTGGDPFVSPQWVAERLNDPDLRLVDATFYLPDDGLSAREVFERMHLPGAVFLDVDALADPASDLPHMLPTPDQAARQLGALGIADTTRVVVYDQQGVKTAGRAWWLLRVLGHTAVHILDGGLPRWRAENLPTESGSASSPPTSVFTPRLRPDLLAGLNAVRAAVSRGTAQIADARPAARFRGDVPEPRPGVRRGHMPGACHVPVSALVDAEPGCIKAPESLRAVFQQAGLQPGTPVITSCGSGVTASTLAAALIRAGYDRVAVYDGSWAEWGRLPDTPVVTGDTDDGDRA